MTKLKRVFLIIIIVVIGLFAAILLSDKIFIQPRQSVNTNVNQAPADSGGDIRKTDETATPLNERTPQEQQFYGVARNFAERYGSFSTDGKFANLEEIKIFSTPKMISKLDQLIDENTRTQNFYGVASKALKVDYEDLAGEQDTVKATVYLQRQEVKDDSSPFVFYQNLELLLIKSENNWLVDEAKWQE